MQRSLWRSHTCPRQVTKRSEAVNASSTHNELRCAESAAPSIWGRLWDESSGGPVPEGSHLRLSVGVRRDDQCRAVRDDYLSARSPEATSIRFLSVA